MASLLDTYRQQIEKLIAEGKYDEAQTMLYGVLSTSNGDGTYTGTYDASKAGGDGLRQWYADQLTAINAGKNPQAQTTPSQIATVDNEVRSQAKIEHAQQMANWNAYLKELQTPLSMDNPMVARMAQLAVDATSQNDRLRGVGGGMSGQNAQQAAMNTLAQLEGQRQDRLGQALGASGQYRLGNTGQDMGYLGFKQGQYEFGQNMNLQNRQLDWQKQSFQQQMDWDKQRYFGEQRANQNSALWSGIGTAAGAIGGGLIGLGITGGNPIGAYYGATAGASLGGGAAGLLSGGGYNTGSNGGRY